MCLYLCPYGGHAILIEHGEVVPLPIPTMYTDVLELFVDEVVDVDLLKFLSPVEARGRSLVGHDEGFIHVPEPLGHILQEGAHRGGVGQVHRELVLVLQISHVPHHAQHAWLVRRR